MLQEMLAKLAGHKKFILFIIVHTVVSLLTVCDFPTVDKTNDDMWYFDRIIAAHEDGFSKQSFFLFDDENEKYLQLSLFDLSGLPFVRFSGWSIFSLRLRSVFYGVVMIVVFYMFTLKFLGSISIATYASALLSLTYGFLYRSHDVRTEIAVSLVSLALFITCYSLTTSTEKARKRWLLFVVSFLPIFCFRMIHPNGILLMLIIIGVLLINRFDLFQDYRNYIWVAAGCITYLALELTSRAAITYLFSPQDVSSNAVNFFNVGALLRWLAVYHVTDFSNFEGIVKSAYHIGGLILKYPFRFIDRIDTANFLSGIDITLFVVGGLLCPFFLFRRKLDSQGKFLLSWVGCYFVFFPLITISTTDYSIYALPFFVLIIVTSMHCLLKPFGLQGRRILLAATTLQAGLVFFFLFKIKYQDRYHNQLVEIESQLKLNIESKSRVLGAPLYFTLLQPELDLEYKEFYCSLHLTLIGDYTVDSLFQEIRNRNFDYIIFDSFIEQCLTLLDKANASQFVDMLRNSYEECANLEVEYPSQRGMISQIKIYKSLNLRGYSGGGSKPSHSMSLRHCNTY